MFGRSWKRRAAIYARAVSEKETPKSAPRRRPAATPAVQEDAKPAAKRSKTEMVRKILQRMEDKLSKDDVKATLGDYIRLVQLEKELKDEEPREIKVTWIEPAKTESEE